MCVVWARVLGEGLMLRRPKRTKFHPKKKQLLQTLTRVKMSHTLRIPLRLNLVSVLAP